MKLIVGLGNPDDKYKNTFHNLGFMSVDRAAEKLGVEFNKTKCRALVAETKIGAEKIILAKPQTYMNLSGESVRELVSFYKIDGKDVLVIYDDIDIEKGQLRYRPHGSPGTHNGMRSITLHVGQNFKRLRIGAKNTNPQIPLIDYVLMNITEEDAKILAPAIERAGECGCDFAKGVTDDNLMAKFNKNV